MQENNNNLKNKIRQQTVGYIVAAFGLVAGLAWNDAVKSFIEGVFPAGGGQTITAKFLYAVIITLVIVVITTYLSRLIQKEKQ